MHKTSHRLRARLTGGAAAAILLMACGTAAAQDVATFNIAPQPLADALKEFGYQSGHGVLASPSLAQAKVTRGVTGEQDVELALNQLLDGSGLSWRRSGDTFLIEAATAPQSGSAAGDGAEVDTLIVTAQKKEENIQDVPIAISAFTSKDLEEQKIEGGFDLLKAIPNVTFSKNNFTSYNFSIRGIGTKAVSATTDPGVSVSFNSTGLIQNRLFEQEYFDIERVEVLRGPQGTLYGRNATAGVINVISAKPDLNDFDGWIRGEVGNFHTKRVSAMVNVPLVEDQLAVRLAGALTSRDGYDLNEKTGHAINGRDLWSARLSVGFEPTEFIRANFIWERFNEDDDRSRTGKQLCHRDDGPLTVGGATLPDAGISLLKPLFSTGCKAGSLYEDAAFGTPNGLALPFVFATLALGSYCGPGCSVLYPIGVDQPFYPNATPTSNGPQNTNARQVTIIDRVDPYGGMMQSRDLRVISSIRDPIYRANADIFQLNVDIDVGDSLTLTSQTVYNDDQVYSFQDFNRFNTVPIFNDTGQLYSTRPNDYRQDRNARSRFASLAPGGIFCDPQIGCSDTMAGFDISQADGTQFSQEIRLQSDFDGPINFSVGANYTKFDVNVDYYVMFNLITALAQIPPLAPVPAYGEDIDPSSCRWQAFPLDFGPPIGESYYPLDVDPPLSIDDPDMACIYIDPNPVERIDGEGHNYFRSQNPYELESWAGFGEMYWNVNERLNVTVGLRYTDDTKTFTQIPSQLLTAKNVLLYGEVGKGYPIAGVIEQNWGEWTGRLAVDWKPEIFFTDETMIYGSYSHGYKGGGANPPGIGFADFIQALLPKDYGPTFEPEFVDAFEIGAKNTLLGGGLVLNASAFYYDYKDYQVSQIKDRTAVNENFDATVWGLEFETMFAPTRDLRIIANLGYLDTEIADGETSIDLMNRTQGNSNYVVAKPWMQFPSNCVVPLHVAEEFVSQSGGGTAGWYQLCLDDGGVSLQDTILGGTYNVGNYPELNGGAGIFADLGGNELPNAPHWTANLGAQYGWDFLDGWRATVRGDVYWQSQSYHRVYNYEPYDKLRGWYNANLSVWIEKPDDELKIELYVKNLLDDTPITDAFLNSDDTALTTNVFTLDPRLIGLSIRKGF